LDILRFAFFRPLNPEPVIGCTESMQEPIKKTPPRMRATFLNLLAANLRREAGHTLQEEEQLPKRLRQSCRELSTHAMNFLSQSSTHFLLFLFSFLSAMAFTSYSYVARRGIDSVY
jgi:hypothetical protein